MNNIYYIYIYLNPLKPKNCKYQHNDFIINEEYEPFYLGKGNGKRDVSHCLLSHLTDGTHKSNTILDIIRKDSYPIIKRLFVNLSEDEAYGLEKIFVGKIGRRINNTGSLTNLQEGGRKTLHAQATKDRISNTKKLQNFKPIITPEMVEKIKASWTDERRKAYSDRMAYKHKTVPATEKQLKHRKDFVEKSKSPEIRAFVGKKIKEYYKTHEDSRKIKVYQYSKNMELIQEWSGVNQAAYSLGLQRANISRALNGISSHGKETHLYRNYNWFKNKI